MTQTHTTYLSLGSNLGDRADNLRRAIEQIAASVGTVTMQSPIYETQSWGYSDEDYLNQTIACETALTPLQLLQTVNTIESQMGRIRSGNGYEARPIDIDILFYDNEILDTPQLVIPHPKIALRRFVLQPTADIAPDFVHPTIHKTIRQLLEECEDTGQCIIHQS
ncbi:MAG: 2-amino-4-hydroxy-6-hydroxymethyldihydropteridine diphosphokinase [Bacteroidales bacterium]|nr:2-amino-4-hydroxy-6-hydroxymethyldihydropteridine diphosphokinase [Bacteroidales bacterium]